jgi:hypothetical protein
VQEVPPQYHGKPTGAHADVAPPRGQVDDVGDVTSSRKHRRSEEQGGGDTSNKRVHTEGDGGGHGQLHPTPESKDARRKSYRGRGSRWGERAGKEGGMCLGRLGVGQNSPRFCVHSNLGGSRGRSDIKLGGSRGGSDILNQRELVVGHLPIRVAKRPNKFPFACP